MRKNSEKKDLCLRKNTQFHFPGAQNKKSILNKILSNTEQNKALSK